MNNTEDLGIRLRADGVFETTTGLEMTGKAADNLGKKLDDLGGKVPAIEPIAPGIKRVGEAANTAAPQVAKVGVSAAQTTAALRQLPAQITDIVTSLQGGQSPLTVLIQQGGQIKDSFGGIGPAFRGIIGAASPMVLALGSVAAVLGVVTLAYHTGSAENDAYRRGILLTGNAIGVTTGQLAVMAQQADRTAGSQHAAADALAQAAGTGAIAANNLLLAANVSLAMQKNLGRQVQDTVAEFAALGRDPVQASQKLNSQYHYLTASVFDQIRALNAQGRELEAGELAQKTYGEAMAKRSKTAVENLGFLEKSWRGVGQAAEWALNKTLNIGRGTTPEEQLKAMQDARGARALGSGYDSRALVAAEQKRNDEVEANLQARVALAKAAASATAEIARREAKQQEEASVAHQSALAEVELSGFQYRQAQADRQRQIDLVGIERGYAEGTLSLQGYQRVRYSLTKAGYDAEMALIDKQVALTQRQPVDTSDDVLARAKKLTDLSAQRYAVLKNIDALNEQRRTFQLQPQAELAPNRSAAETFFRFEREQQEATEEGIRQRQIASNQADAALLERNRDLNISLIRDDRARGMAQIAVEEEDLRKRLDIGSQSADDQKRITDDLARWRVLRERQLTEELKPEWQRMLEAWADTTQHMKTAFNDFQSSFIREGEDAWVQFMKTGKVSVSSMVDFTLTQLARLAYQQKVAPMVASFGEQVWGIISTMVGGSGMTIDTGGYGITNDSTGSLVSNGLGGGRASGGRVERGSLHPVNEEGPEVLSVGGRDYLMMGSQGGNVVPNDQALRPASGGGKTTVLNYNPTFHIDARTDRAEVYDLMLKASEQSQADLLEKMSRNQV